MTKRLAAVACLCAIVGAAAAWYFWPRTPPVDPQVQEAKALQTKLVASLTKSDDVKETIQSMSKLRDSMEKMTPDQRREVMTGPGGPMATMRREAEAFAELPVEKRKQFLDDRIDRMEKIMAAFKAMGGRPMGPRPGGQGGPSTSENRLERSREILNRTTPEDRALLSDYFSALMERRKERGLPGFGP